jgi:hypothetical protein
MLPIPDAHYIKWQESDMNKLILLALLLIFKTLVAGNGEDHIQFEPNIEKINLIESSVQSTDSLFLDEIEEKSAIRAALYSAVIPGAGQYYAGSIWKTILFAGLEITGWTVYIVNTSKGDKQESQMEDYADTHWSERKYWSYLYYKGKDAGEIDPDKYLVDENEILIDYDADVINDLRSLETALGYTHHLPETKTQQYYEMIVKYLTQFGNAWEDANFNDYYYGNADIMTPQMFVYRDMRNDMNGFYDVASAASNIILINHVLSALDAAWTASRYNRKITMKIRAYKKRYFDENIQMVGINLSW